MARHRLMFLVVAIGLSIVGRAAPGAEATSDAAQAKYIAEHRSDYNWFAHAANGYDGVPFILVRLLPELDPDIWGSADDQFDRFGFFQIAGDDGRPLPSALGWDPMLARDAGSQIPAAGMDKVTLTCAACHVGRVRTGAGLLDLVGAPSTQVDVRGWRHAFEQFAARRLTGEEKIRTTAARLIELEGAKPADFFYRRYGGIDPQHEVEQRQAFRDGIERELHDLAGKIAFGKLAVDLQRIRSYAKDNRPPLNGATPGQSDGSGDLIPKLLLLDEMTAAASQGDPKTATARAFAAFMLKPHPALINDKATATDILSTWNQADHTTAQIDGSVRSPFFRNVAAILAIVSNPVRVNQHSAVFSERLLRHLPPPAYPFEIDRKRAKRGKKLFSRHCAVCHRPRNETAYRDLGTDPNRSQVLNDQTVALFLRHFRASVPEGFSYVDASGATIKPRELDADQIVNASRASAAQQGYITDALAGIWARAPYLHNGSVPTLRHVLAPNASDSKRPDKFLRGALDYDRTFVGFVWQPERLQTARRDDPVVAIYDCNWDGCSNSGHDRDVEVDGKLRKLDWSADPEGLTDLLEYLKTL